MSPSPNPSDNDGSRLAPSPAREVERVLTITSLIIVFSPAGDLRRGSQQTNGAGTRPGNMFTWSQTLAAVSSRPNPDSAIAPASRAFPAALRHSPKAYATGRLFTYSPYKE